MSVKSSGMQEMEFPQMSCDNSISVSGSPSTEATHPGPCALTALCFLGVCETLELMQVLDG